MNSIALTLETAVGIGITLALYALVFVPALTRFAEHHPAIAARRDAKLHR